jgi:hypothetical protein
MPQGQKPNTDKQAGRAAPIAERRGASRDEVERPAQTAVGKDDGGEPGGSGPSPVARPAGLAAQGRRGRMDDREQRIREIAYFLWEQEAYPDGRAEEHWAAAEAVADAQDAERKTGEEDPQGKPLEK